jgi:hypothetical protein
MTYVLTMVPGFMRDSNRGSLHLLRRCQQRTDDDRRQHAAEYHLTKCAAAAIAGLALVR